MDLVVSGTDDSLVEQLSFKLPSTASYANERRLVSAFPSGASQFSPDGVRVARFVITGENWLDPSTLRLAFKIKKAQPVGPSLSLLSPLGKPYHSPRTRARDEWSANYTLLGLHNWARICITVALQPGSAMSQPTPRS